MCVCDTSAKMCVRDGLPICKTTGSTLYRFPQHKSVNFTHPKWCVPTIRSEYLYLYNTCKWLLLHERVLCTLGNSYILVTGIGLHTFATRALTWGGGGWARSHQIQFMQNCTLQPNYARVARHRMRRICEMDERTASAGNPAHNNKLSSSSSSSTCVARASHVMSSLSAGSRLKTGSTVARSCTQIMCVLFASAR